MADLRLFERFPALRSTLPREPLATLPTPITPVSLDVAGRNVPLLIKRDDLTGEPYGGNKIRKLEFLLADARRQGARRLITAGAFGSHHALATTIYGRRLGFDVSCVLFPQHRTPHVRDILRMIAAHGAELRFTRRLEGVPFALLRARWAHRHERACVVPPGGSSPLGTLGYVEAGLELDAQMRAGECDVPSAIYVAAGTLGTAAGLAIGLAIAGRAIPVFATRITAAIVTNTRVLEKLVRGTLALLEGAGAAVPDAATVLAPVRIEHGQVGAGYGRETEAGRAAHDAFAAAGLRLDPTYTAKAAAALLAAPTARGGGRPLFWLTLSRHEPRDVAAAFDVRGIPEPFAAALAD
jgi:1-aminocyclopropane-1-carboxylate deaminase/D-cysteine desulfhydrase-like pyridoxal-dependent ACC family enzyme